MGDRKKAYRVVDGTSFRAGTPDAVIRILAHSLQTGNRLRIHYGFTEANTAPGEVHAGKDIGRDWLEEWHVTGRVGRSTGQIKIPLILPSERSTGGPSLLDDCIVKIRASIGETVLYQHPKYHTGLVTLEFTPDKVLNKKNWPYSVNVDGKGHAAFETETKRTAWLRKMGLMEAVKQATNTFTGDAK